MTSTTACSSDDGGGNETVVRTRIDAVWAAVGADPAAVQVLAYGRTERPGADACAGLPEDDRWWGAQRSRLPPGEVAQATLLDRLETALADDGFVVRRYKSTGSETRILDGVNEEEGVTVQLFVTDDGAASLDVKAGPCATALRTEPDPPYVPEG